MRRRMPLASKVKAALLTLLAMYIFAQVFASSGWFFPHDNEDVPFKRTQRQKDIPNKMRSRPNKLASRPDWQNVGSSQAAGLRSNIIINSYMRAGSSFIGRLLGYHPESFYVYEPLWKYSIWDYYDGRDRICDSKSCACRRGHLASTMVDRLRAMVSCEGLREVVVAKMTPFYSGIPWMNFTSCLMEHPIRGRKHEMTNDDPIPTACLRKMKLVCLRHKHTVAKVLRLTVSMYHNLLNTTRDTKVVHLFRDPRATLNSRLKTKWYPIKTLADIHENAKCLCKRMLADYEAGLALQELYPDRFKVVFYEDLMTNLQEKTDKLYRFAGIGTIATIGEEIFQSIANFGFKSDHSQRDNTTDYSSWWRRSIDWGMLEVIDRACNKVYSTMGYSRFESEVQLRDMTKSSFIIPPDNRL